MGFKSTQDVPILIIVFNRPKLTQQVLDVIAKIKPHKLYIAADGPRINHATDADNCKQTRALFEDFSWDCTILKRFQTQNLGCKLAVSSAINWFFNHEEAGIILEDDCLPHIRFFDFVHQMLNRYEFNNQVMHIAGSNLLMGKKTKNQQDYYYSRYPNIWGWATWRRAWLNYEVDLSPAMKKLEKTNIRQLMPDYWQALTLVNYLKKVHLGKINTWDYQWMYTVLANKGFAVIPTENLVINLGFNMDSTHQWEQDAVFKKVTYGNPPLEWHAKNQVNPNNYLDAYYFYNIYRKGFLGKLKLFKLFLSSLNW